MSRWMLLGCLTGLAACSLPQALEPNMGADPLVEPDADTDSDTEGDTDIDPGAVDAPADDDAVVFDDRMMVRPASSMSPDDLAAVALAVGATVDQAVGSSGYAILRFPSGELQTVSTRLAAYPEISTILPVAHTVGAEVSAIDVVGYQWHLDRVGRTPSDREEPAGAGVRVAVLDTGMAYANSGRYLAAPSLAHVPIVAPVDLVNLDSSPLDDHQHGTHIASLIASSGLVHGVAPGVSLMPIKVLDSNNQGTEFALIEGLWHALDNGAEVINLSLSMHPDYAPSPALLEALDAVMDAGIVVVAAAGNSGMRSVSWPAAHPGVIAVGATAYNTESEIVPAPYSNTGVMVDVVAPGGSMASDWDGNGLGDGMVAETIGLREPGSIGPWMFEGTSQAAAVTTGVVASLIAEGVPADNARTILLHGARDRWGDNGVGPGRGYGAVDYDASLALYTSGHQATGELGDVGVAILPVLIDLGGGQAVPVVHLSAIDSSGTPLNGVQLHGTFEGSTSSAFECVTRPSDDGGPRCVVQGTSVLLDTEGDGHAWRIEVHASRERSGRIDRPSAALFATDALDVVLTAAEAEPLLDDAMLALHWLPGRDDLGDLAEAFVVADSGAGRLSRASVVMFTPEAIRSGTKSTVALDLDATGLLSETVGEQSVTLLDFGGSGLLSSPMGFRRTRFFALGGSGLLSSPMGLHPTHIYSTFSAPRTAVWASSYDGEGIHLASASIGGATGASTNTLGERISSGGWTSTDGYDGAAVLAGSGWIPSAMTLVAGSEAGGGQAVTEPVEP